jgi:methyl-accepting chemotaxis protein
MSLDPTPILVALGAALAGAALATVIARRRAAAFAAAMSARVVAAERQNEVLNDSVIGLLQAVHRISQRDLTARAPVTTDVVGAIGDAINQLAGETAAALAAVQTTAATVERASREVKAQSASVSETAEEERGELDRMVQSVGRAAESMQRIALLAHNSNRVAVQAGRIVETALGRVTTTLAGMDAVRATIADVERRIKRLGERSHEIGQTVNVINTIAERTHVLALNASMQAAVAGEAGRGFAVVAEEVQRLAESARQATERIEKVIWSIQAETNDAIAAMTRTIERVAAEAVSAGDTGTRMEETREITVRLVEMVGRIAGVAEQHTEIARELRERIDRFGVGNRRSTERIAEQTATAEGLLAAAERLVSTVGVFKLPAATTGEGR